MRPMDMTAVELGTAIREREITAPEALQAVFAEIDRKEERLHCYITLDREAAVRRAEAVQKKIDAVNSRIQEMLGRLLFLAQMLLSRWFLF